MRRTVLQVGAAVLLTAVEAPGARASVKVPSIQLTLILATHLDGGASVDVRLPNLTRLMKSEPFARYNVFALLDRKQFPLEAGKTVTYPLVNGRNVEVTLARVTPAGAGERRYQLVAHIGEPGKAAYLKGLQVTLSENQPFYVGGQSYQGGTLFLELALVP